MIPGLNETFGAICLTPAQISFVAAAIENNLFQFGLFMLAMGLIFGFAFGWIVKRDWG
jgi:hypothetical protein